MLESPPPPARPPRRRRRAALGVAAVALLAGLLAGGLLVGGSALDRGDEKAASTQAERAATTTPSTIEPPPPQPRPEPGPERWLAWTAGGLPGGFGAGLAALPEVEVASVVRAGTTDLVASRDASGAVVDAPPPGWTIPLETIAVDPSSYAALVADADADADAVAVAFLTPGQGLLGETSAELRGIGAGGQLDLGTGATVTVAGVVPDDLVGGAELVVPYADGPALGIGSDRHAVFTTTPAADPAAVRPAVRSLASGTPVQVRAPGEARYLRSADAVLPLALIKEAFGEFAHRPAGGRDLQLDPGWVDEHLVTAEVPVLGTIRCHRVLVEALQGAMQELVDAGLGGLVGSYDGCWNPRRISTGGPISRHAFGAAVDVNFSVDPDPAPTQDDRLVEVMERWGFVSGDDWLVPDSGHFEYVAPPDPDA